MPPRVFLVSPVRLDGVRGRLLREGRGRSALAEALRSPDGAPIGDVFTYISGLYFRGKLTYARRFTRPPTGARWLARGVLVITQNRGLVPADSRIVRSHLDAFAGTDIAEDEADFVTPLQRDAESLLAAIGDGDVVLLGSLATPKYLAPLSRVLGNRLVVPSVLHGKGDMARGALLLRHAKSGQELAYEVGRAKR